MNRHRVNKTTRPNVDTLPGYAEKLAADGGSVDSIGFTVGIDEPENRAVAGA